jgi:type IV pilus assembly protein PilC
LTTTAQAADIKNTSFSFRVIKKDKKPESGTVVAVDRQEAILRLKANTSYQTILSVSEQAGNTVGKKARAKPRSLVAFARQLELCLDVMNDERDAIKAIMQGGDMEDAVLTHGLTEVHKLMGNGVKMHDAMARYPYIFPEVMVATLRAGYASGKVAAAAAQAADDIEEEDDQRARIKKALTYPTVVLVMSLGIFVALMMGVVPQFAKLYDNLSGGTAKLPAITQLVMAISEQMTWATPLAVGLFLVGLTWYKRNSQEIAVREFVDPLKLKLPIFGNLFRKVALSRFCRTYAALAERLHPTMALEITATAVGNIVMERAILKARDGKLDGDSVAESLSKEPIFPKLLLTFIAIGDDTGRTPKSLRSIGRLYKRDVDDITNRMEALIQPFFLLIIAAMVLVIALAVYLPYFSIGDIISPY